MNKNTIIQTDICKYEYKYEYYNKHNKKNMFVDIKAIKVLKLMFICAKIYKLWCLVYSIFFKQNFLIWINIFFYYTNIFVLIEKGKYKYKYIWFEQKGRIRI